VKKLRIGLVGASRVATYAVIAPAREIEGVEVTAVAARDPSRARDYAAEHGIERVLPDYEALFVDPDIDLVYIGTPPLLHADQAMAAIREGKPVLVEKPFALTSADARRVELFAAERGVPVFEAMHSPHHRLFSRILDIVHSGLLGSLQHIDAVFDAPIDPGDPIRWRLELGGGALMDLGVYPLAWVRRIAGEDFSIVSMNAHMRDGVDESFEATLDFGGGLTARLASTMVAEAPVVRLRVEGSSGVMSVVNPLVPQRGHMLTLEIDGKTTSETVAGPSSYAAQLAAVRATVLDGVPFLHDRGDYVRSMEAIERLRAAMPRGEYFNRIHI
jgi:predicted dehydrogenase